MREREPQVEVRRDRCPFCHEAVPATPERTACNACGAWHHAACWSERPRCGACSFERPGAAPGSSIVCEWRGCGRPAAKKIGLAVLCGAHVRASRLRTVRLLVVMLVALVVFGGELARRGSVAEAAGLLAVGVVLAVCAVGIRHEALRGEGKP